MLVKCNNYLKKILILLNKGQSSAHFQYNFYGRPASTSTQNPVFMYMRHCLSKQMDRQTDRQTDGRTGNDKYVYPAQVTGHKNLNKQQISILQVCFLRKQSPIHNSF